MPFSQTVYGVKVVECRYDVLIKFFNMMKGRISQVNVGESNQNDPDDQADHRNTERTVCTVTVSFPAHPYVYLSMCLNN